jgi:hypothetical protein
MFVDGVHEVGASGVGADGEAATEGLSVGGKVGGDAIELLGAPGCETEAGDDFIEDEDDTEFAGDGAETFEEAWGRGQAAVEGFYDDGGDVVGVGAEEVGGGVEVVVGGDEDVVFDPGCAGSGGVAVGEVAGLAVDHAGDADGMLSVVGAFETDDATPAGGGVSDAEAEEGGLGTGGDETDAFGAGAELEETFGEFDGAVVNGGEVGAIGGGLGGGGEDFGAGMAGEGGAPGHGEVEELPAIGIPDAGTGAALEDGDEFGWETEFSVGTGGEGEEGAFPPGAGRAGLGGVHQGRLKVLT